jgi:hypothetical protein
MAPFTCTTGDVLPLNKHTTSEAFIGNRVTKNTRLPPETDDDVNDDDDDEYDEVIMMIIMMMIMMMMIMMMR